MIAVIARNRTTFDQWLKTMEEADRDQFYYLGTLDEARQMTFAGVVRIGDDWHFRWNGRELYEQVTGDLLCVPFL